MFRNRCLRLDRACCDRFRSGVIASRDRGHELLVHHIVEPLGRVVSGDQQRVARVAGREMVVPITVPVVKVALKAAQTLRNRVAGGGVLLRQHLQDRQVRLNRVFRRRQDVGDQVLALHDLLIERTADFRLPHGPERHRPAKAHGRHDDHGK